MISRGPISGSAGSGAAVAGSGLGVRLAVVDPRLAVVLVLVFGFAGSVASPLSSVFAVSSTAGVATGFGVTGAGLMVRRPAGLRVRGGVVAAVFGASSIFSGGAPSGDSAGVAVGIAAGIDAGAPAASVTGGQGSGNRSTDETRFVFHYPLKLGLSVAYHSAMLDPPASVRRSTEEQLISSFVVIRTSRFDSKNQILSLT